MKVKRKCKGTTWMKQPSALRKAAREAEEAFDGSCVLYFAQAGQGGPIKIGITSQRRLRRRIQELQNACPWRVTLHRIVPGSLALESALQSALRDLRMNGEWFYPDPVLARIAGAVELDLTDNAECA